LRECRGLTFHKNGRILARKYAKFFNLGEKNETMPQAIDFNQPHRILSKMDGSMITPVFTGEDIWDISGELLEWHTKMGKTDVAAPVAEWVSRHENYARYSAHVIMAGYTPIFEWCSRQQKIVIDYPQDRLVLTAIRNNKTGEYRSYEDLSKVIEGHGIELVRALPGTVENLDLFVEETRHLKGEEGYVVRFDNGHMIKVKAEEYCLIHRTKDGLRLDKDVVALVLSDNVDDIKSFMDEGDRKRIDDFSNAFEHEVAKTSARLTLLGLGGYRATGGDKKNFAVKFIKSQSWAPMESGILFSLFDIIQNNEGYSNGSLDLFDETNRLIRNIIKKNTSSGTKIQGVSHLFGGLSWERDFRDPNIIFDDEDFLS
jgi:T4 RnlA family RNA ligase